MRFPMEQKKRPPYKPMTYFDLAFKRLVMVRNWVLHTLQCVHSHLMTQVVQSMSDHLNAHILQCATLTNIIAVHKSFINTIHDHCFLTVGDSVMVGVDQVYSLFSSGSLGTLFTMYLCPLYTVAESGDGRSKRVDEPDGGRGGQR